VDDHYGDLAAALAAALSARRPSPRVVGISGGQGTGKSTLAASLAAALTRAAPGDRTAVLSLDDFYLTRAERDRLASDVHPLLRTRGVPGTHDIAELLRALDRLFTARRTPVPVFDKGHDDRMGEREIEGPVERVILEGWCLGARPQPEADLLHPVNALERLEDPDGRFRRFVNEALAGPYARLAARIEFLVYLDAPDMAAVLAFRTEQEQTVAPALRMDLAALARFVAHYERITRALADEAPALADVVVRLRADRSYSVQGPAATVPPESMAH
jgi:D-glycerate 3-kinase